MVLYVILFVAFSYVFGNYLNKLYAEWNFDHWEKRKVRGPKPKAFVGTFPKHSARVSNLIDEYHDIYMQYKYTDRFVGVFVGRNPKLFITDPILAKQILTTDFKNFRFNESSLWTSPSVEQLRIQSPFVATGDYWKERRTELVAAITSYKLKAFHTNILNTTNKVVEYISQNQHKELNGWELGQRFTADAMINFVWGLEEESFAPQFSKIHQMANEMMKQAGQCFWNFYLRSDVMKFFNKFSPVRFFPEHTDRFFKKLAIDSLEARKNNNLQRTDFINHLVQLQEKKGLTDVQIAGHTTAMVVDAYSTTSGVLAQTLLLLAKYPRVQQKLREELADLAVLEYNALDKLQYLDQCLNECVRIYPSLPTLFKICTERTTLKNKDGTELVLEPDDRVHISSFSFHYDPDYFENPSEFIPERFDEQFGGIKKFTDMGVFLGFGDGPRKCPGVRLGVYQIKMAVAAIVKNFNVKAVGKTLPENKIANMPSLFNAAGDITLSFEKLSST